jgi:hypothetical protein
MTLEACQAEIAHLRWVADRLLALLAAMEDGFDSDTRNEASRLVGAYFELADDEGENTDWDAVFAKAQEQD